MAKRPVKCFSRMPDRNLWCFYPCVNNSISAVGKINKKYLFKRYLAAIQLCEFVFSVLLFIAQGHPTRENKVDTLTTHKIRLVLLLQVFKPKQVLIHNHCYKM